MRTAMLLSMIALVSLAAAARAGESPAKAIDLFNGKNLSNWSWRSDVKDSKIEDVWSVDEGGILVCQGNPRGYIRTKDSYENYKLTLQWRWPEGTERGNNGVLVHTTEDHVLGVWPRSIEVQLASGNAGDFWVIGTEIDVPDEQERVKGRRHLNLTDDSEKPIGEWNTMEIVCRDDKVTVKVNEQLVNEGTAASQRKGAISLQSEGALIHFRKIKLEPLEKEDK